MGIELKTRKLIIGISVTVTLVVVVVVAISVVLILSMAIILCDDKIMRQDVYSSVNSIHNILEEKDLMIYN